MSVHKALAESPRGRFNIQPWKLNSLFLSNAIVQHTLRSGAIETWVIDTFIGEGTYGVVSRQICISGPSVGQYHAVKKIRKLGNRQKSICREVEALVMFSDSGNNSRYSIRFVRFLGWYENETHFHIAMEYAPYGDLKDFLRNDPCSESEAACIIAQVAQALKCMHELDFVHRDLKPENILVFRPGPRWHVKITDFDAAKNTQHTAARSWVGTEAFMAPELSLCLHHDSCDYTSAVDIWSLGAVAREIGSNSSPHDINRGSRAFVNFVNSLMKPSPMLRPTIDEVLRHEWLLPAIQDVWTQQQMPATQLASLARSPVASSALSPTTSVWSSISPSESSMASDITVRADGKEPPVNTIRPVDSFPQTDQTTRTTSRPVGFGNDATLSRSQQPQSAQSSRPRDYNVNPRRLHANSTFAARARRKD
ncbi:kinase-like domain-containing protein [Hypoxylon cercidicola]|nr:kinase-like domain-containing protein [Hypoxylon cercidicola]